MPLPPARIKPISPTALRTAELHDFPHQEMVRRISEAPSMLAPHEAPRTTNTKGWDLFLFPFQQRFESHRSRNLPAHVGVLFQLKGGSNE